MNENLISVIIPCQNGINYLKEAIDSVKRQEMNTEIIVIDDGSTDGTAHLAKQCGARVYSIAHSGLSVARNVGLKNAKGGFILFLDHDDVMNDNALKTLYDELVSDDALDYTQGKLVDFISPELPQDEKAKLKPRKEPYGGVLPGAFLFRKSIFEAIGGFDESLQTGQGVDFLLRCDNANGGGDLRLKSLILSQRCADSTPQIWAGQCKAKKTKTTPQSSAQNSWQKSQNNPLISIIIPVKNGANYIKEAIDSIKNQNVVTQIIVVDDGSTDNTADIAQNLGCIVIKHERNKGQVIAKNTALKYIDSNGGGEFVMFCDHDDLLTPNTLQTMLKEFEIDSELMAVMTKTKDFISPEIPTIEKQKIIIKPEPYFGCLGSCALIKKQVFEIIGLFDESIMAGEIIDWQSKMDSHNLKIKKLDFVSALRRIHLTNFGKTHKQKEFKDYAALLKNRIKSKANSTNADIIGGGGIDTI
ncbi:glycosyltransferase family 2 protein [Helicobacter sp. T3_23-1056]